jgi:hypothetical protein
MDLDKARSIFDLNQAYSRELARKRPTRVTAESVKALLPSLAPEPEIEIPTTLLKGAAHADVLMVVVSERGRNSAHATEVANLLSRAGYSVLSADLRGWGETTPNKERPERNSWDDYFAWTCVELGQPLLAMRVSDLLATVHRMANGYKKVYVAGLEGAGLVALHAAVIDNRIAGVATNRTLVSYQDVLDRRRPAEPVAGFVWGALTRYDLPDLGKAVSPRAYVAVDPFDAGRRPVSGSDPVAAPAAVEAMLKGLHLA